MVSAALSTNVARHEIACDAWHHTALLHSVYYALSITQLHSAYYNNAYCNCAPYRTASGIARHRSSKQFGDLVHMYRPTRMIRHAPHRSARRHRHVLGFIQIA